MDFHDWPKQPVLVGCSKENSCQDERVAMMVADVVDTIWDAMTWLVAPDSVVAPMFPKALQGLFVVLWNMEQDNVPYLAMAAD